MPFVKGQSGNPGGRTKIDPRVKEMFQAKGEDAFHVIANLLTSEDEKVRLSAAQTLLDRAYGKVPTPVVGGDEDESPMRIINEVRYTVIDPIKIDGPA